MDRYDHRKVEKKWQERWEEDGVFCANDKSKKKKKYILDMFPYPSAQGLHVGHPEGYTASDIYSRYLRMKGYEVLHPMGFDAFGLPAENYALKTGTHPRTTTDTNIENMRRQIKSLGFSYDWEREVITTDPKYFKWTQWIFLKLFEHGLAYEADAPINWCPKDKTGLANEEVVDGKCDRCGTVVTKKKIKQWLVKITDERYIERLLNDLEKVDWPENIKRMQRNWIGKSEGAEITFPILTSLPKKVVILHGYQGDPDTGWKAWAIPLLRKAGVEVHAPRLPGGSHPDLTTHIRILEKIGIDDETVVIGHSLGCITAIEYILSKSVHIKRLILVAPPYVPAHPQSVPEYPSGVSAYSEWQYDFTALRKLCAERIVIGDLEDDKVPLPEPRMLAERLQARLIEEVAPRRHYANRNLGPYESWTILNTIAPGLGQRIRVFTTRPDTVFGATYLVLAPEHPLVSAVTTPEQYGAVQKYIARAANKSDLERTDLVKDKTGVYTGGHVVNPATGLPIPVWIADYVLASYGSGAIMAVPAHDERDWAFAKTYGLPIREVVAQKDYRFKSCLIIHGRPSKDHSQETGYVGEENMHWIPWVRQQLEQRGTAVYSPRMPRPWEPEYHAWKATVEQLDIDESSVIVAHSAGAAFAVRWISESRRRIRKLILVAPAKIPPARDGAMLAAFYDFDLDPEIRRYVGEAVIFTSPEDDPRHQKSAQIYAQAFGITPISLTGHGHYTLRDMGSEEFPELLSEVSLSRPYDGEGIAMCSGTFDGLVTAKAAKKIVDWLHTQHAGRHAVSYKLRDWLFSRQRYWGEPIPIVHCPDDGHVAVPVGQLPVELPDVERYEPTGTGESPLATIEKWVNVKCPKCGKPAKRETNTMPQWAGSNWYFLRYCDPGNGKKLADTKKLEKWLPVDMYIGGAEHAVLHLLYARFIYKFLCDIGVIPKTVVKKYGDEPFTRLKNQGLILGEDGQKMSKSRGNVVNPDEVIEKFGADTMRMYEMFMGPFEDAKPWSTQGMVGVRRFLDKAWNIFQTRTARVSGRPAKSSVKRVPAMGEMNKFTHRLIKKVTNDIEQSKFNTSVSAFMEYMNTVGEKQTGFNNKDFEVFTQLLSPFAPHLAEELWEHLGHEESISQEPWPVFDPKMIVEDEITVVVQINGKVREQLHVAPDISEDDIRTLALSSEKVQKWLDGKKPKKVIYVQGRLVSIVV